MACPFSRHSPTSRTVPPGRARCPAPPRAAATGLIGAFRPTWAAWPRSSRRGWWSGSLEQRAPGRDLIQPPYHAAHIVGDSHGLVSAAGSDGCHGGRPGLGATSARPAGTPDGAAGYAAAGCAREKRTAKKERRRYQIPRGTLCSTEPLHQPRRDRFRRIDDNHIDGGIAWTQASAGNWP